jgi:pSer/pThr/pTyr-binding forkhead associated (FHA) protein
MDNDIILSDPTVSRYHAQLRWREGGYHLYPPAVTPLDKPTSSSHAEQARGASPQTRVNRRPVVQCSLQPGDIMTLGQTTIKILLDKAET